MLADGTYCQDVLTATNIAVHQDESVFLNDDGSTDADADAAQHPAAAAALAHDPNLRQLRFRLVPKHLTEDQFWQRYFAEVSRIKHDVVSRRDDAGTDPDHVFVYKWTPPYTARGHCMSPTWCSSAASCASVHRVFRPVLEDDSARSHYGSQTQEGSVVAMQPVFDDEGWLLL